MGTSGAYGGSGAKPWADAQDSVAALPSTSPATSTQIAQTVQQVAAAVDRLFKASRTPATYNHSPGSVLGAGSAAGGVTSGRTRSNGGGMSSRNAARGGAVLWAGHAATAGDQADLDQLGVGLRLEDMQGLTQNERCAYILDRVLGAPGTPDEEVLRRASLQALKELANDPDRSVDESMSAFMAAYVYETALIDLTSHKASLKLTPAQALAHEKDIKGYIRSTAKYSGVTDGPRISINGFLNKVAGFRDQALNLLRKALP